MSADTDLLSLPQEIRQVIYTHLLSKPQSATPGIITIYFSSPFCSIKTHYSLSRTLPFLLVCQQIHREVLALLFRITTVLVMPNFESIDLGILNVPLQWRMNIKEVVVELNQARTLGDLRVDVMKTTRKMAMLERVVVREGKRERVIEVKDDQLLQSGGLVSNLPENHLEDRGSAKIASTEH
jgi:hypothetical protein